MTSITKFTQEKSHLSKCPAFFIYLNIFLDYISLCPEAYIHILGISKAYTLILKKNKTKKKNNRFILFEFRRKRAMIRNLSMN